VLAGVNHADIGLIHAGADLHFGQIPGDAEERRRLKTGGDGLADIMGRGIRSPKLPWSKRKTVAGSTGMFVGGWTLAAFILSMFVLAGVFAGPFSGYLPPITGIALVGTVVESLPIKDIDNVTVTLAAVALGYLLF